MILLTLSARLKPCPCYKAFESGGPGGFGRDDGGFLGMGLRGFGRNRVSTLLAERVVFVWVEALLVGQF